MTSAVMNRQNRVMRSNGWWRNFTRNGWVIGVLAARLYCSWYTTLIPKFGPFQISSVSKNSLPLVYLAIGQAIIVIAGGVDLSLGAAAADQHDCCPLYG
ncbi:MAG: hypothetical protein U0175_07415 [Caldilineaceae bacterium]